MEENEENNEMTDEEIGNIDWGEDEKWSFYSSGLPESARDSGYKNAAYALGELVDNSIQAGADDVEIIMLERFGGSGKRRNWNVQEIGILDNGCGMDPMLQRLSIKYQSGSTQMGIDRGSEDKQMGKFGVGLPQASISQARRLEVYTWTSGGPANATFTYIDFDEPETFSRVPRPIREAVPDKWIGCSDSWEDSGTLIIWAKPDKFSWTTSKAVHRNSEFVIGRMYRNHISENGVSIRIAAFENDPPYNVRWTDRDGDKIKSREEEHDWDIRANDPLYLDPDAFSGNAPENPAFEQFGEDEQLDFEWKDREGKIRKESVTLRFSIAKNITRAGKTYDPKVHNQGMGGNEEHGKHMKRNLGLSIVRERRELELDDGYCVGAGNAPWERWWGAEVNFGRGMDELLGVTNNKQHAQGLNDVSKKEWKDWDFDEEGLTTRQIKEDLEIEDFPTFVCLCIKERIEKNLKIMRKQIVATSIKKKSSRVTRHEGAEHLASEATKRRQKDGNQGQSDEYEGMSMEEKSEAIRRDLSKKGLDEDVIDLLEGKIIGSGYKVVFSEREMDSEAFFSVEQQVGSLIIYFNEGHGAYKHLFAALDSAELQGDDLSKDQVQQRAVHAASAVKLILAAWARYEDESSPEERKRLQKFRREWGSVADEFMDDYSGGYT